MKITRVVDQSSPLFLKEFDCQIDTLLGTGRLGPSDELLGIAQLLPVVPDCSAGPEGIEFRGEGDSTLTLELVPCTYWAYRMKNPGYHTSDVELSKLFPLTVDLQAFYEFDCEGADHPSRSETPFPEPAFAGFADPRIPDDTASKPRRTLPKAVVITLESLPLQAQVRLVIDYNLPEDEPLQWLRRTLFGEYEEAGGHPGPHALQEHKSHVSPEEQPPDSCAQADDGWNQLRIRRPVRQSTLERWKREYSAMSELDEEYSYRDEESPKWADYVDSLKHELGKEPTERHLRDVKKAGDAGLLR